MKVTVIDCKNFTSVPQAHKYIAGKLNFPAYYGKNLDALYDCLSELECSTGVILTSGSKAAEQLGDYADKIFEVFYEALKSSFRVVIL